MRKCKSASTISRRELTHDQKPIEFYAGLARDGESFPWRRDYLILLMNLSNQIPFTLSRWGDGEWSAIFRRAGVNCDGHPYFVEMGESLERIIRSEPEYLCGAQRWSLSPDGDFPNGDVVRWIRENGIRKQWINGDLLHQASMEVME